MKIRLGHFLLGVLISMSAWSVTEKDIVGTWRLQNYVLLKKDEDVAWCRKPVGLLIYTSNGYMSVGINCVDPENEKQFTTNPKDMVFYTGRYSIKPPHKVIHHVENSSDISRIGQALEREAKLEKDLITITGMGVKGPVRLLWKKEH